MAFRYSWQIAAALSAMVVGLVLAQNPQPAEGVRQLYYFGAKASKDTLPPVQRSAARTKNATAEGQTSMAVMNLGLRYNLVLVQRGNVSVPVDSTRNFRNGECVAIEVQANRSGYLYVMGKQSDGNWIPLLPSMQMPDEINVLDPGMKVRAPKGYCFEITDPPGTETLVVVLSRDPRDFQKLYDGIRASSPVQNTAPRPAPQTPLQIADARLINSTVEQMSSQFGETRNLAVRRVTQPEMPEEPPYVVYVVNHSGRPSSTIVVRVEINHHY
jgi:hypothetical protein